MQLLILLILMGILSGSLSGAYIGGGPDSMILGASSGLVLGVIIWVLSGVAFRVRREHRLNQYFSQDGQELE